MFIRWKGADPGAEVMASVRWFEKKEDLPGFYTPTSKEMAYKFGRLEGDALWMTAENGDSWTDGEHFLVTLGGSPRPSDETVKGWLAWIGCKVAEIEKDGRQHPVPSHNLSKMIRVAIMIIPLERKALPGIRCITFVGIHAPADFHDAFCPPTPRLSVLALLCLSATAK